MRVLWIFLFALSLWAKSPVQTLHLEPGPVKDALKKSYRIYLTPNITAEIEQELERRVPKNDYIRLLAPPPRHVEWWKFWRWW